MGLSATARIILPVRVNARNGNRSPSRSGGGGVFELLRADAQAGEAPVAQHRKVVAARVVAEAEADGVFQHDGQGHRGDRRGERAGRGEAGAARLRR